MEKILTKEILTPIIIIIICFLICFFSKRVVSKLLNIKNKKLDVKKYKAIINLINNLIRVFVISISLILILESCGVDTASFVASLGVFSLVLGLAIQDVLKDFISGMYLVFEGQYNIGDWVKIGDFKGEVLASNFRTTKLKSYTGEIKIISNRNINEIINYSLSKSTVIVDVSVSYESDLTKVRKVLDNLCLILKEEKKVKEIECLGIQELQANGITYRVVAYDDHSEHFALSRIIKEEIVLAFNRHNIVIPYPQLVVHDAKRI